MICFVIKVLYFCHEVECGFIYGIEDVLTIYITDFMRNIYLKTIILFVGMILYLQMLEATSSVDSIAYYIVGQVSFYISQGTCVY